MGTSILFWNCKGIRPTRKELELYLKKNVIDVIALNKTFLSKKTQFQNSRLWYYQKWPFNWPKRRCCLSCKNGLVVNKEYRNDDFNIITNNEALAIELELYNNQNLTMATIYYPNGNPNLSFFQTINNLSDNVMFVGDFNSKLGRAKKNTSSPMLKNIQRNWTLFT